MANKIFSFAASGNADSVTISTKFENDIELMNCYEDNNPSSDEIPVKLEILDKGALVQNGSCNASVSRTFYTALRKNLGI